MALRPRGALTAMRSHRDPMILFVAAFRFHECGSLDATGPAHTDVRRISSRIARDHSWSKLILTSFTVLETSTMENRRKKCRFTSTSSPSSSSASTQSPA